MAVPYHSALSNGKQQEAAPLTEPFHHMGSSVFKWDINDGIPPEFGGCDLVYAEPSWPHGLSKFDERAGAAGHSYNEYAQAICEVILMGKPTVLLASTHVLAIAPPVDYSTSIVLNGNKVKAYFWNGAVGFGDTHHALISNLAENYSKVWDFCAGYGTTGRLFLAAGASCVLTDYNAECCGYMAEQIEGWGL